MKVIIPLGGLGTRLRPLTWSRAKPLLRLAGDTVIGHILRELAPVTTAEVIFVVGYKGEQIEAWIRSHHPHLNARFVTQHEPLGQAHAVWLCRDYLDDGQVLVVFGDGIIRGAFASIPVDAPAAADAVLLVKEVPDPRTFGVVAVDESGWVRQFIEKPDTWAHRQAVAGVYWFRHGQFLRAALDTIIDEGRQTKGEYYLADAFNLMLEQGARLAVREIDLWLDAGKPDTMLATNRRLLELGPPYATEDAVARGRAEGFTVVPPVYLDPTAIVEESVVGPYVSLEAGATVRRAVVRNSIIDRNATVHDLVLDSALIGEDARVAGTAHALFVGDDGSIGPAPDPSLESV